MTQDDIPKRVILVLLILTIVISVLGTWTVLDAVSTARPKAPSKAQANVKLGILDPNTVPEEPAPKESTAQGVVGITIE